MSSEIYGVTVDPAGWPQPATGRIGAMPIVSIHNFIKATSMTTDDHTTARQALNDSLYHDGGLASDMSLLDYFAGKALTGILAYEDHHANIAAHKSYEQAVAMLNERERLENERR